MAEERRQLRAGNNPKEPINVIQRWVVSCLELGHFAFSPGWVLSNLVRCLGESTVALEGIARGRRGEETKKFDQAKRKHGEYSLAIGKTREAIDKKHEKEKKKKKLECEPWRWELSKSRSVWTYWRLTAPCLLTLLGCFGGGS